MQTEAEIVSEMTRLLLQLAEVDEPLNGRQHSTGMAGIQLGRMICRADWATALAMAVDVVEHSGLTMSEEAVVGEAVAMMVQTQAVERVVLPGHTPPPPASLSRGRGRAVVEAVSRAHEWVRVLRTQLSPHERRLVEAVATRRSWRSLEAEFPGRDWASLRDDFERIALRLWMMHCGWLSRTIDAIAASPGPRRRTA